jgi:DNA helicase HerA-like ATPase
MTPFEPTTDLRIGHLVEVSGTVARVELSGDVLELTRSYGGRVYSIGQIGSVVKIHSGRRLTFGFVSLLRMRSEELAVLTTPIPPDADQRIMEIELFGEGVWHSGGHDLSFTRGVTAYPLPRQGVYLLTREEAEMLYGSAESQRNEGPDPLVEFGSYVGAETATCRANIDKMFGLHCAVLGSTGSGKSGAVAALLHSVLEHRPVAGGEFHPRIVIIDPHAEYAKAFGSRATAYRAYNPLRADEETGTSIKLPYWLMSAEEWRALIVGKTEFEATSQHNTVYKALTHARMVAAGLISPAPSAYGAPDSVLGDPKPAPGVTQEQLGDFDRDKPRPFSLAEFERHITFVQGARAKGAVTEKKPDSEFAKDYRSILDKLGVLRHDPRIRFLMEEWTRESASLADVLSQFVAAQGDGTPGTDIRIIDISGLPNEVAGPLTAVLARLLFNYKLYQSVEERRRDPLLIVCEEAHRYVPDRGEAEYAAAQSAIRRVAREGRKYGLGLMLVSQRPADIESTVLAQCGTWLILRLSNSTDQQHVSRFLPDGLAGMTRALASLGQQEALFVGEGASLPARVRIRNLTEDQLPRSENPKFAQGWSGVQLSRMEIEGIAHRMSARAPN